MKKIHLFINLLLLACLLNFEAKGYETPNKQTIVNPAPDSIYTVVDTLPIFNGNLKSYLDSNLQYPTIAYENRIEGEVSVQFVIDKEGNIQKNTVAIYNKNAGWGMDKEAIRLVSNMPPWIPGRLNGENVAVRYILLIKFEWKEMK